MGLQSYFTNIFNSSSYIFFRLFIDWQLKAKYCNNLQNTLWDCSVVSAIFSTFLFKFLCFILNKYVHFTALCRTHAGTAEAIPDLSLFSLLFSLWHNEHKLAALCRIAMRLQPRFQLITRSAQIQTKKLRLKLSDTCTVDIKNHLANIKLFRILCDLYYLSLFINILFFLFGYNITKIFLCLAK